MPTDAPPPVRPAGTRSPPVRGGDGAVVTAVLVAHDGAAWLPRALAGLAAQTRAPDRVVAVDTGSQDASRELLAAALGAASVLDAPRTTGFGAAVSQALAHVAPPEGVGRPHWLWLLHDDLEPDPWALAHLLAEADGDRSIALAGPKLRGWYDRRLLLEVGVTIARSGRRETLLERREQDQGQHDGTRTVLAVSTAGLLVRSDVWAALGGLDPALPLLRDDVDLGWRATSAGHRVVCVTDAVAYHAEAAAHGRRPIDVGRVRRRRAPAHAYRLDRQHALRVLLLNLPWPRLPLAVVRLAFGTLLRAAGLLLGKSPGRALAELLALFSLLARPARLVSGRRDRSRTRRGPSRAALRLLAPRGSGGRHLLEAAQLLVGPLLGIGPPAAAGGAHRAVETGPAAPESEELPVAGGLARRAVTRPGLLLGVGLTVLTLLAGRHLLGDGRLVGGALLPAPDSAGDLWRTYTESWHPVGLGSDTDAPPYLAVVAGLGSVLLGDASRAVDLLVLGAVPLAALSGYLGVRRVVGSLPLRIWAATGYCLLPPVVGAVAAGRLGTAVVAVLLPLAALAGARVVGATGPSRVGDRPDRSRAAWAAGLLLAVMTAFAPATYLLALPLLAVAAVAASRGRDLARLLVVAVVPPVLLLPWLPAVVADPSLLLLEAGLPGPDLADERLAPASVLLLHPGGPGMSPLVLTAGVLLAGLAALLRRDRRGLVLAGWAAALVGLAGALVQSRLTATVPALPTAVPAWPGPAVLVAGAGLLLAATVGAENARSRLATRDFGWRQPVALAVAVVAGLAPVLAAGWWVGTGAGDPVRRRDSVLLPAFVAAEAVRPARPRTLSLRRDGSHRLTYALLGAHGPRLGDAETASRSPAATGLDRAVADLASGRGGDAAAALLPYGVRFVLMTVPTGDGTDAAALPLARDIDADPGLLRVSAPEGLLVWRVGYPSGRVRVLDRHEPVTTSGTVVPAGPVGATAEIGGGRSGRLLTVADRRGGGWRATLDGRRLPATRYDGWAQAFRLPAEGGTLVLRHDAGLRPALLWIQAAALLLVLILLLPSVRADADADDPDPGAAGETADGTGGSVPGPDLVGASLRGPAP